MRFSHRKRCSRRAVSVDVAPLIDMVFILLLFFMVTTTFDIEGGLDIQKPRATEPTPLPAESFRVTIARGGGIYVGGSPVDLDDLRPRIVRFLASVPRGAVVIVPDESVSSGRLVEVLDEATVAGARDIAVATRREDP